MEISRVNVRRVATDFVNTIDRTACMERKKPGPPWKGPRKQVAVRLPLPLAAAALKYAEQHGMTFNDFLGEMLAEKTGVPYQPQGALMAS
jgi:hypothetical protein